jgi:hypothetical protein
MNMPDLPDKFRESSGECPIKSKMEFQAEFQEVGALESL